ncbi:MAG: translocation/assembly module TamB domain-containing protein, partial [Bacteroidaceae bacterium]|nr:translocation/assembly module TamB domain-containing protein [Bacteroidaceae bacterium]
EMDDNSVQQVEFNAGVVVSNDLNNLAVDFTMSAPDNSVIQNQLNELDRATLSRYAIAMIITGSYLGGRQGVTATSALSAFLDAKINQLSGTAIKDFNVNIGINDAMNAETGNAYTNYSFSFSKRFLNDRITVVIGGELNSGDRPDKSAGNETFINNISLEWKLNQAGNRYIRIFYDKNYQSLLEGEITETGVGYVYKRKLNSLKELFTFKRKAKKQQPDGTKKRKSKE